MNFIIGDRIHHRNLGYGVIKKYAPGHSRGEVWGVVFDNYDPRMHTLRGTHRQPSCPDGHGWWCKESNMVLVNKRSRE